MAPKAVLVALTDNTSYIDQTEEDPTNTHSLWMRTDYSLHMFLSKLHVLSTISDLKQATAYQFTLCSFMMRSDRV